MERYFEETEAEIKVPPANAGFHQWPGKTPPAVISGIVIRNFYLLIVPVL